MVQIQTLNDISNIIYKVLPADDYVVASDISEPDAILVRSAKCHDMVLPPKLRAIARAGAGVNNIPVERCTQNGIVVFNTPGANANAVKELVFASMLMSSRHLIDAVAWCQTLKGKGGEISALVEDGKKQFVGHEIKGKTLGVIGLGAIGVMVANYGYALGLNVVGYDPFISVEHAWGLSRAVRRANSLVDAVSRADYITIHVPLSPNTQGFFDEKICSHIKRGATLLNFARGELVDQNAVCAALESEQIRQYIVDFPSEQLLGLKNVICIPHLGASTPESEENCAKMAAVQLKDFLENGNIKNSVNFPDCDMPRSGAMRICILNANMPNMIGQFTALLSLRGANITNLLNKSRSDYAYTIIDLDETVNHNLQEELTAIEGVVRVTVL